MSFTLLHTLFLRSLRGLWVLNVGNMQAIQSGFYLLHDKFFEIISNIFGQPTLHGSITQKSSQIVDCRERNKVLLEHLRFLFSIMKII